VIASTPLPPFPSGSSPVSLETPIDSLPAQPTSASSAASTPTSHLQKNSQNTQNNLGKANKQNKQQPQQQQQQQPQQQQLQQGRQKGNRQTQQQQQLVQQQQQQQAADVPRYRITIGPCKCYPELFVLQELLALDRKMRDMEARVVSLEKEAYQLRQQQDADRAATLFSCPTRTSSNFFLGNSMHSRFDFVITSLQRIERALNVVPPAPAAAPVLLSSLQFTERRLITVSNLLLLAPHRWPQAWQRVV